MVVWLKPCESRSSPGALPETLSPIGLRVSFCPKFGREKPEPEPEPGLNLSELAKAKAKAKAEAKAEAKAKAKAKAKAEARGKGPNLTTAPGRFRRNRAP
ncbi:hypothetical protein, partial [Xanthomonas arboricola]|uniref:hypothetical protein n=1 Tax=Xanthomonas arboricola TaxID=56448 RepID=UPI001C8499D4